MSSPTMVVPIFPDHPLDHPLPSLYELQARRCHLERLCSTIRKAKPEFRLYFEYLAAILLVDKQKIGSRGRLSTTAVSLYVVKDRLEFISPFCKHYMFHLDPKNFEDDNWQHAKPRLPEPQHPVNHELFNMDNIDEDIIRAAMYYSSCFKTDPDLDPVHPDQEQEDLCLERDGRKCVLTGESNVRIFHFIPITWNDTVDHNNATGMLKGASVEIADINLLNAPATICSANELGTSHKAWNMLCVNEDIYGYLVKGLCSFRFMNYETIGKGQALVNLQFYWMPKLPGRFNVDISKERFQAATEGLKLLQRFTTYYNQGCPTEFPESSEIGKKLKSGHSIDMTMSEQDAMKLESAVKVHWACILFTALCGGAGRAWNLTGMDLSNGSLDPRDHAFEGEDYEE
ncbi:hypothetical protein FPOA_02264 [Fusarium poae]|uniref:HNH nuclease domain-containing protein n=1 Tax=Fusarium poae TaxID=36050 RepID=A0A1B8B6G4_FUSPO|nr:hypothetical protein FPOA_02264 [Fusarium poae]